jgi:hypothetical protein
VQALGGTSLKQMLVEPAVGIESGIELRTINSLVMPNEKKITSLYQAVRLVGKF